MKLEDIKQIARQRGIRPGKMRKADIVRAIQTAELNRPCFATDMVDRCGQPGCLWRSNCR